MLEASSSHAHRADFSSPYFDESVEALITIVRQLVEFTSWRFGLVQGKTISKFACPPERDRENEIKRYVECHRRQQRRIDPRAAAIVKDADFPHAIATTLTMPDGNDSMLVLLRDEAAGAFTDYDFRLIAQAKVLAEECLVSGFFAEKPAESTAAIFLRSKPMLFILDGLYKVVMAHRLDQANDEDATGGSLFVERLPKVFEDSVRALTLDWARDPQTPVNAIATPLPFLSLRVQGMIGRSEQFLAVTIEPMRRRNILLRAAKQFLITPREREVASFLLDGLRIEDIGDRLSISTSTVNDHVKKLVERTNATNRSQMLARLLGWQTKN